MSHDKKYRERVLALVDSGKTQEEVRKMFRLGVNTITQWKKQENYQIVQAKKIAPEKLREYFAAQLSLAVRRKQ